MNQVVLVGRLTRDPELRYSQQGVPVCKFTIAVDRKFKKDEADFINCVSFQKTAELCANYLAKGRQAAIAGRMQTRNYENSEGRKVYVTEVIVDEVQFLDKGNSSPSDSPSAASSNWNDVGQELDLGDDDIF